MVRSERPYEVESAGFADRLVLSDERPVEYELSDDLTLAVEGRLERTPPHVLHVIVKAVPKNSGVADRFGANPMVAEVFAPLELLTEAVRDQFVTVVEETYPDDLGNGKTRLQGRLNELAETIADGRLLVMDETVRFLLEATESVRYRPHAERPRWQVRLVDERTGTDRTLEISTREWALADPGFLLDKHVPDQLGLASPFHDYPERWRVVRSVWQRMAGRDERSERGDVQRSRSREHANDD
jgi:hypothetical protein